MWGYMRVCAADQKHFSSKFKLPNNQNGQVYLTSHRICYVDKQEPRKHSVALNLKDVEKYEHYAGFLKSSPKVTLIPKVTKRSSLASQAATRGHTPTGSGSASPAPGTDPRNRSTAPTPSPATAATWVCTICSFSNPVPSNFDPTLASEHTPLPPCLACGIKPALSHILKASISNATGRQASNSISSISSPLPLRPNLPASVDSSQRNSPFPPAPNQPSTITADDGFQCPRCTFLNHPSLLSCEICGSPLISHDVPQQVIQERDQPRIDSPGPMLNPGNAIGMDGHESVKISFRGGGGGDKIFVERLKGSLTQRKWLLHEAPPVPNSSRGGIDSSDSLSRSGSGAGRRKTAGIAGLEQMGLDRRKNNELIIGDAFEDLDALMASGKQIVALAESLARQTKNGTDGANSEVNALLAESASELGLVTTKDIVGGGSGSGAENLYLSELARNLAEFLTDDARGVLRKAGGIMSLVDLWAVFNRARGGVELVSPNDFEKAARLWEKLKLPVRLRTFKSGVLVVQGRDRTDDTTIKALLAWLRDLHDIPPDRDVPWDWQEFGRGVTAQDTAERFGWSIGVAEEELEMAEERGVLCREEGIEGLRFWENYIDTGEHRDRRSRPKTEADDILKALNKSGFI
ncbi:hypothetical protein G7054_g5171 [Neopestalotiopsis clavispora]|nr:hypothetical protein G7054_g5171 [Neopestalotiopsis clavispora]